MSDDSIIANSVFAFYNSEFSNLGLYAQNASIYRYVCGKLETDLDTLFGWNTFLFLYNKKKKDLTLCRRYSTREAHFPNDCRLYEEKMPENLREAHDRNDEVLERIYIGRRFKNDTERLEKLFELYVKMTEAPQKLEFNS